MSLHYSYGCYHFKEEITESNKYSWCPAQIPFMEVHPTIRGCRNGLLTAHACSLLHSWAELTCWGIRDGEKGRTGCEMTNWCGAITAHPICLWVEQPLWCNSQSRAPHGIRLILRFSWNYILAQFLPQLLPHFLIRFSLEPFLHECLF